MTPCMVPRCQRAISQRRKRKKKNEKEGQKMTATNMGKVKLYHHLIQLAPTSFILLSILSIVPKPPSHIYFATPGSLGVVVFVYALA